MRYQAVKVTHVGNSVGVVLTRDMLRKLCVGAGEYVFFVDSPDGFRLTTYDPNLDRYLAAARFYMQIDRELLRAATRFEAYAEEGLT